MYLQFSVNGCDSIIGDRQIARQHSEGVHLGSKLHRLNRLKKSAAGSLGGCSRDLLGRKRPIGGRERGHGSSRLNSSHEMGPGDDSSATSTELLVNSKLAIWCQPWRVASYAYFAFEQMCAEKQERSGGVQN